MSNNYTISSKERIPLREVVKLFNAEFFQTTLVQAVEGDIQAQLITGEMYFSGFGTPVNYEQVKLFEDVIKYDCVISLTLVISGYWMVGEGKERWSPRCKKNTWIYVKN